MVTKPWLLFSPEFAYKMAPFALKFHGALFSNKTLSWKPLNWRGLRFDNPMGISGGLDKNAEHTRDWWTYGVGFIELGTVTPKPQGPNPGKIIDRNLAAGAVWNKMGFPNLGLDAFEAQMKKLSRPYHTPVFINIGKNRDTTNELAHEDYILGIRRLQNYADTFVINISSPNTKGLRDLFAKENLESFLKPILDTQRGLTEPKPMLLKLSPDHSDQQLDAILEVSLDLDIDGWIFTNTSAVAGREHGFPQEGGVSGAPLSQLSKQTLQKAITRLGSSRKGKLLVSSGGIMSADQALERVEMGADLVQVYSALIFQGPGFFQTVASVARNRYS